jgi:hypothetical protein
MPTADPVLFAHAVGDKVEAVYRRGNKLAKRHQLMRDRALSCTIRWVAETPRKAEWR